MDLSHLHALELRASHERVRRDNATGAEREIREVWVAQIEREIAAERAFLGLPAEEPAPEMTLEEILAELET